MKKLNKFTRGTYVVHSEKGSSGMIVGINKNGTVDVLWNFSKTRASISTDFLVII
jgi:hypothetical protein